MEVKMTYLRSWEIQLDKRLEGNFLLAAMWKKLFGGERSILSELGDPIGIEYI